MTTITAPTQESKGLSGVAPATSAAHGAPLTHRVYDNFDQLFAWREEWDALVHATGDDLFASFDWCRIWWKHYGFARNLQVHLLHAGDELVGVFPLFDEKLRLGPFAVRTVRLLACDHSVTTCGLACRSEYLDAAIKKIVDQLDQTIFWDFLHFGPLPGYCEYREALAAGLRQCDSISEVDDQPEGGPHIIFYLPADFETYLEGMPTGERSNIRRRERKLQDLHPRTMLACDDDLDMHFDVFMQQHQAQWKSEGHLGHFGDWPRAVEFHKEMARELLRLDRLQLLRIDTDHGAVGYQYNYLFGKRVYWILGSRSADTRWDSASPGQRLHCATVRLAMAEGRTEIDAMRGMYEYKVRMGGVVKQLQSVTAISRRRGSALRVRGFRACARLLHLLYYRIWFGRLAPHFPYLERPLWTKWIRSRL